MNPTAYGAPEQTPRLREPGDDDDVPVSGWVRTCYCCALPLGNLPENLIYRQAHTKPNGSSYLISYCRPCVTRFGLCGDNLQPRVLTRGSTNVASSDPSW